VEINHPSIRLVGFQVLPTEFRLPWIPHSHPGVKSPYHPEDKEGVRSQSGLIPTIPIGEGKNTLSFFIFLFSINSRKYSLTGMLVLPVGRIIQNPQHQPHYSIIKVCQLLLVLYIFNKNKK
jgi:hypothetical protein